MQDIAARAVDADVRSVLEQAGLTAANAADWIASRPDLSGDYRVDAAASSRYWLGGADLLGRLPPKPKRSPAE
ncbi:MAG: hypothetical protein ACREFI_08995, partial [Stellaceae bacterium]